VRQVASVVKDGQVRYFLVDTEEGSLAEFATVSVPDTFAAEAAVQLGFNLIDAVGLNGTRPKPRTSVRLDRLSREEAQAELALLEGRDPDEDQPTWQASDSVVRYVTAHPGARHADLARTFPDVPKQTITSAIDRARKGGRIVSVAGALFLPEVSRQRTRTRPAVRRDWSHITIEMVEAYIREHPGCMIGDVSQALIGDSSHVSKSTISNRLISMRQRAAKGAGPGVHSEKEPNPNGGVDLVRLSLVE